MANALTAEALLGRWADEDVSLSEVERRLADLRSAASEGGEPFLRTSVLTHLAWVPPEWEDAAADTLAGLAERHPSRALLLLPDPEAPDDGIDAEVALRCFSLPGQEHRVCSEVIELRLRGRRTLAPASVVSPLLVADLPVFMRWRGRPPFGDPALEQLVDLVDRLIVDSGEWPDVPEAYAGLADIFERAAVSDIAWRRGLRWRAALAARWPGIAGVRRLRVEGPLADAALIAGWLRSRLDREIELQHEPAPLLTGLAFDGEPVEPPAEAAASPSDLLSDELDEFSRDPVYEAAVRLAGP